MNPFSNNRPRLTASESLRNKRDKTIYQAEKQRFQNHKTGGNKTGGNKNIKYYDKSTIPLLTYGVLHTSDSFIHCLERAFNSNYESFTIKKKLSRVKKIREQWTNVPFSIAKQELYDCSHKDIIDLLNTEESYIDPSMFVSLASEYYKCNIFLYEINSNHPHGCVETTRGVELK